MRFMDAAGAIVNCAGALQSSMSDDLQAIHETMVERLCQAAQVKGIRRFIHISAMGADRDGSEFSRSKGRGEDIVKASQLDYVILRPSVLFHDAAYGGSALLRGLAALPVYPRFQNTGDLQIVALDDLVDTICILLERTEPCRISVDIAGSDRLSFHENVARIRSWLGRPHAAQLLIPVWFSNLAYQLGDLAAMMRWRPPVRSNARDEIVRGATASTDIWRTLTGIAPQGIDEILRKRPASVQEKWFANLYLLKPLIFVVFGAFWIVTGMVSLGPGWTLGLSTVVSGGVPYWLAVVLVIGGALSDIAVGIAILYRPTAWYGLIGGLVLTGIYVIMGTLIAPYLWIDPLGPMLKIWPIMALNLVAMAILEER